MLLLIPLLPLIGFVANAAWGRRLSKAVSGTVACGVMIGSFLLSAAAVAQLIGLPVERRSVVQQAYTWITSADLNVGLTFRLDPLSAVMILVVTGIGSLIHIYSTAYMHEESDAEFARYFSYLNLFAALMLVLVLGANFLVMFVGWEGVGLCSYLLIGFWYEKKSASNAGKKAFIVNRIGDFGFLLGMLLVFVRFGTLDFQDIAHALAGMAPENGFGVLSLATLLLFVGATGKSAQIPLYVWLPDAMEGPTPVSALIHAATMVTAGVYMIGRNAALFSAAPETLLVVAVIGTATALMAGTIGLVQNDIKRVLAYSTVSQLGYMFLAMGVGAFAAGIFHLYTHAFFKALLFLGSGAVIHALSGEQDLRRMGGLKDQLPLTYWTFLIGAIAIAGVPGLAGFFSKDEILFRTYASGHLVLWSVGLMTSLLTAIYMFRLVFLAFHGAPSDASAGPAHPEDEEPAAHQAHGLGAQHNAPSTNSQPPAPDTRTGHPASGTRHPLHDAPAAMAVALVVLAVGSVVAGYAGLPAVLGGGDWFGRFLEPSFHVTTAHEPGGGGVELALMVLSSGVALAGIGIALYFFLRNRSAAAALADRFSGAYRLLLNKYYVDEAYDATVVQPLRILSAEGLWKIVDTRIIDGTVNGIGRFVSGSSEILRRTQSDSVRAYAASLFLGAVAVLGYYLWR
jgi:NADH-quinone oxidoreductase subunit L